jgi:hypothetical protein
MTDIDPAAIKAEHRNALHSAKRAICESCVKPWPCVTYRLAEAYESYPELTDRLSGLLRGVADALKGPPPELTSWSWHDLPEKAQELAAALAEAQEREQRILARVLDLRVRDAGHVALAVDIYAILRPDLDLAEDGPQDGAT